MILNAGKQPHFSKLAKFTLGTESLSVLLTSLTGRDGHNVTNNYDDGRQVFSHICLWQKKQRMKIK